MNAEDLPTFVFLGDVPEDQQDEVRKRTADIVGFFDELYGIRVPGLTLYFSETVPLLQGATEEVLGVSRTVACGIYSSAVRRASQIWVSRTEASSAAPDATS